MIFYLCKLDFWRLPYLFSVVLCCVSKQWDFLSQWPLLLGRFERWDGYKNKTLSSRVLSDQTVTVLTLLPGARSVSKGEAPIK